MVRGDFTHASPRLLPAWTTACATPKNALIALSRHVTLVIESTR